MTALAALLEITRRSLLVLVIWVYGDGEAGETSEMGKGGWMIWVAFLFRLTLLPLRRA